MAPDTVKGCFCNFFMLIEVLRTWLKVLEFTHLVCLCLSHTMTESKNEIQTFDTRGKTGKKSAWKPNMNKKVQVNVQHTTISHWYHTQLHRKCCRHHRGRLVHERMQERRVLLLCTDYSPSDWASLLR